MKSIYVLLSRTDTVPARIIRTFTTGEFSHASVSLLPRTDNFYSFARRKVNNPLFAGFISENVHTKVFAKYPDAHCAIYQINVSDEGYEKARELIRFFRTNKKKATYSFAGALAMRFGIIYRRKYKFACSQFVAYLLDRTGDVSLPKDPYLMLPNDFLDIPGIKLIYDGTLQNCVFPAAQN